MAICSWHGRGVQHCKVAGCEGATESACLQILPVSDRLDGSYLFHFLPAALNEIEHRSSFVTVKHLSRSRLKEIPLPLPPIEEQRRIAAVLDAADSLRTKRRQALAKLETLTQAIFIDMFGPLEADRKVWPTVEFGSIVRSHELGLVRERKNSTRGIPGRTFG